MNRPRIAVVFACYNRKDVALECVARLRAQTRLPERVVIADNDSSDGTAQALGESGWEALEVLNTGGNLGNAGAVRLAMERAFEGGADAVWILDDDSWPRPDALEALLAEVWDDRVVRHPLQVDPKTGRFSWPLQVVGQGGVSIARSEEDLPQGAAVPSRGVWTGALIPRGVREAVGEVNGGLFIRGEDEDYPRRIERAGFRFEAVRGAVLDHPGPGELVELSIFGKRLYIERGLEAWKVYYKVRNMIWIARNERGIPAALALTLAYLYGFLRVEGPARMSWRAVLDGVWDGFSGRLGRWRRHPE